MSAYDFVIIGAGIIGAAVANELSQKRPGAKILLLDKASQAASQQTGRNSGVIHAGVYYPPGSYKATFCRQGLEETLSLCKQYQLPYEQCGKLLVATEDTELPAMEALFARCEQNALSPQMLTAHRIRQMEPNIRAQGGFLVRQTGITDYKAVTNCLLKLAQARASVDIRFNHKVVQLVEQSESVNVVASSPAGEKVYQGGFVINCAGIFSDTLIRSQGLACDFRMLPFRGEYYRLTEKYNQVASHLIYPIPDPAMPFLGVHLTKMIGGYTTVGPNAILATGKEVYEGIFSSQSQWLDIFGKADIWKLLWRFRKSVMSELRSSLSKTYYAKLVSRYCPGITAADFLPYRAGIRAQAVDQNGNLIHDFKFISSPLSLHIGNAPSPAATSAIPIAREIVSRIF